MSLDDTGSTAGKSILGVAKNDQHKPLSDCVRDAMDNYFSQLNGHDASFVYEMVMEEVERPLFESVLSYTGGNQTKAATLLGISRSTLRKKLAHYQLS